MIEHKNVPPASPARIVLLGSRGFIGAAIRREAAELGLPHVALGSDQLDLTQPGAAAQLAGLLQPSDAVVMLSALTPDKGRDTATLMKNLTMMQSVCAALDNVGCAHLVYFSSDAVYDPAVSVVSESTPASPQDLYGVMHYARELMARGLTKIPLLILRPTLVYGLDDTHNSYGANRFRRAAAKDRKITLFGGGEETRDYVHVDDVARLALRCVSHKSTGVLNVATGVSHSFQDVASLVARQFDGRVETVTTPRANPIMHRHYDITNRIKGFPDFRFTPLEQGIAAVHRDAGLPTGQPSA